MGSSPQVDLYYALRTVVGQLNAFVADPQNLVLIDDQPELASIVSDAGTISGDVNHLLQMNTQLLIRAGWYLTKYQGYLATVSRECTTSFNTVYNHQRDRGYGEWDAKRRAEQDPTFLQYSERRDRLGLLVNILKVLVDACNQRLPALQQISNNYRAELRGDKSIV